jgi:hypothetical protein
MHTFISEASSYRSNTYMISIRNDDYWKLDHGLTTRDVNRKDRQNYGSGARIASDDVLALLVDNVDTYETVVYLWMLKMVIKAYFGKSTTISKRIPSPSFSKRNRRFQNALYLLRAFSRLGIIVLSRSYVSPLVGVDSA